MINIFLEHVRRQTNYCRGVSSLRQTRATSLSTQRSRRVSAYTGLQIKYDGATPKDRIEHRDGCCENAAVAVRLVAECTLPALSRNRTPPPLKLTPHREKPLVPIPVE